MRIADFKRVLMSLQRGFEAERYALPSQRRGGRDRSRLNLRNYFGSARASTLLCAFSINYAAASGRTDHPRYGPALEIVDRPGANLARSRGMKAACQARTFQTLNEGTQASRTYRRAPSVVDARPELHPVNWFESFKSPHTNLAVHAIHNECATFRSSERLLSNALRVLQKYLKRAIAQCAGHNRKTFYLS